MVFGIGIVSVGVSAIHKNGRAHTTRLFCIPRYAPGGQRPNPPEGIVMPSRVGAANGPVPKRESERRRNNKNPAGPTTHSPGAPVVTVPPADPEWLPLARDWYDSLAGSGQSRYYEPSDWMTAQYVATAMSRNLAQGGKMSSMMFGSVMSAMTELMTTEGSRRRLRLELDRNATTDADEDASVTSLAAYKGRLTSG